MYINEMLNKKTYIGDIEPNPKEFGIWIKNDGSHMIHDYTNREWICNCSGSSNIISYYRIAPSTINPQLYQYTANVKVYDVTENRFEHISTMAASSNMEMIAPNFSFDTDECYIAFLPLNIQMELPDGNKNRITAYTFEDLFLLMGLEIPSGVTRITEEEYWNDTIPSIFYIVNRNKKKVAFQYDEGMTLGDWVNSDYNSIGLYHITKYDLWNATNANFGASDKEYGACKMAIEDTNGEITYDVLPTFPIQNGMTISLLIVD